jgi:ABC-type polysaccharide/polyol phosphate export permease
VRPFLLLVRLRVMEVFRQRSTGIFFLGLPLLFLVLVGVIFANGHPFERRRLAVVGEVPAALSQFPELRVERVGREAAFGKLGAHIINGVLDGNTLTVGQFDQLFGRGLASALGARLELLESVKWGFVHYTFPGMLVFCIAISGLFGMGYNMVRYRQNLFLRKLSTTRLSRSTFVAAQIAGRGLYILAQALLLLAIGWLFFRLPLTLSSALWTLGLTVLGLWAFLGIGFVFACFLRTEALIYDAISAVAWPIVLLSEFFFPADELPAPLPHLAAALPSTQLVRMLRAVLLYHDTSRLLPGVAVIAAWIVVTFALAWHFFRWND